MYLIRFLEDPITAAATNSERSAKEVVVLETMAMALQQLCGGKLVGRSVEACAFTSSVSASISAPSDACAPIFARNGASLSPKCRPFFGARVASVSG